jgi:hypothetical protein
MSSRRRSVSSGCRVEPLVVRVSLLDSATAIAEADIPPSRSARTRPGHGEPAGPGRASGRALQVLLTTSADTSYSPGISAATTTTSIRHLFLRRYGEYTTGSGLVRLRPARRHDGQRERGSPVPAPLTRTGRTAGETASARLDATMCGRLAIREAGLHRGAGLTAMPPGRQMTLLVRARTAGRPSGDTSGRDPEGLARRPGAQARGSGGRGHRPRRRPRRPALSSPDVLLAASDADWLHERSLPARHCDECPPPMQTHCRSCSDARAVMEHLDPDTRRRDRLTWTSSAASSSS